MLNRDILFKISSALHKVATKYDIPGDKDKWIDIEDVYRIVISPSTEYTYNICSINTINYNPRMGLQHIIIASYVGTSRAYTDNIGYYSPHMFSIRCARENQIAAVELYNETEYANEVMDIPVVLQNSKERESSWFQYSLLDNYKLYDTMCLMYDVNKILPKGEILMYEAFVNLQDEELQKIYEELIKHV